MLYQQIARNKRKTYVIFFVFFAILGAIGSVVGELWIGSYMIGIIFALIVTAFYAVIMYIESTYLIMHMNGARQIKSSEEEPRLWNIVEELALVAHIPMPDIYIIDDSSPNALATGRDPEHAAVAVTSSLYEMMTREELEGVLAHEISHIRNYDIRVSTISVALSSAVVYLCSILSHMYLFGSHDDKERDSKESGNVRIILYVVGIIFSIIGPMVASLVQLAVSRNREYLADASAVELTRNPQGLIGALKKLDDNYKPMKDVDEASATLYISAPIKKRHISQLFDTHPPLSERIDRLESM